METDNVCIAQETFQESDEGVYSCSQGMFSCGEEPENNDQIVIGGYQLDSRSEEKLDFDDESDYIFVRLYRGIYKNHFEPVAVLDKFIKLINHSSTPTNLIYNHVAINGKLTDDFSGLSLDKDSFALKQESCTKQTTNLFKSCDINKSEFVVFGIKVDKSDYNSVSKFINDCLKSKELTYNIFKLPWLAITNIIEKVKMEFKKIKFSNSIESKVEDDEVDIRKLKEGFVCSTFVAYTMWKYTKVGKKMDAKNIKYGNCMPNDVVVQIPGFKQLFTGRYIDYNVEMANFVSKNPQFKKYMIKG